MAEWSFRDYLDQSGSNLIRGWIDSLPKPARVKIDAWILILEGMRTWPPQYVSALKGCDDIYELRIVQGGVQYRPIGCHGPDRREFTLLLGAVAKGRLPRTFCETAQQRRQIILTQRGRSREHEFAEESD